MSPLPLDVRAQSTTAVAAMRCASAHHEKAAGRKVRAAAGAPGALRAPKPGWPLVRSPRCQAVSAYRPSRECPATSASPLPSPNSSVRISMPNCGPAGDRSFAADWSPAQRIGCNLHWRSFARTRTINRQVQKRHQHPGLWQAGLPEAHGAGDKTDVRFAGAQCANKLDCQP